MASYLKTTYIDGSLTVEGPVKLKAVEMEGSSFTTLEEPDRIQKIVRTGSDVSSQLTTTAFGTYISLENTDPSVILSVDNETQDLSPVKALELQITSGNTGTGFDSGSVQTNTVCKVGPVKDLVEQTAANGSILASSSQTTDYNPDLLCIPVVELQLWDHQQGGSASDYQWHYNKQNP